MRRFVFSALLTGCIVACLTAPAEVQGLQKDPKACLKISKETAPPGGMAQVKVFTTEPKPIMTGGGSLTFDEFGSIEGIALMSALDDVVGAAVVRGSQLTIRLESPSATFGLASDYPILTVAGRIPADAPRGLKYPIAFNQGSLQLFDQFGGLYEVQTQPGELLTAPGVAIHDVKPGSAVVQAGGVVTITGSSFVPGTVISFNEATLSEVRYIDPTRIDVVLATEARMHGMMIQATNPDKTHATYYSYQRTYPMRQRSIDPVLRYTVPLPAPQTVMAASIPFPSPALNSTYGVAVQNIGDDGAVVLAELADGGGTVVGTTELSVPPGRYTVRLLSELFGAACSAECTVRITSADGPVQVLGIVADQLTGAASPIVPAVLR